MKENYLQLFRKEKRKRLFRAGRPLVRLLQIFEGSKYHKDIAILWVAYSKSPFHGFDKNLSQSEFAEEIVRISQNNIFWMVEDANKHFDKSGPIALCYALNDGWLVEPHVSFFPWATSRNKLRSTVAFFQWIRYQKIGACLVKIIQSSKPLFDKCMEYGVLHYVGRVENGDPRGDMFIYSIKGKLDHG